jgi:hypothetical protein
MFCAAVAALVKYLRRFASGGDCNALACTKSDRNAPGSSDHRWREFAASCLACQNDQTRCALEQLAQNYEAKASEIERPNAQRRPAPVETRE